MFRLIISLLLLVAGFSNAYTLSEMPACNEVSDDDKKIAIVFANGMFNSKGERNRSKELLK